MQNGGMGDGTLTQQEHTSKENENAKKLLDRPLV